MARSLLARLQANVEKETLQSILVTRSPGTYCRHDRLQSHIEASCRLLCDDVKYLGH